MAHDGGLSRELTTLRRGWGLETEGLLSRVGPLISGWCELHRAKNDREARRVLRAAIESAIEEFPWKTASRSPSRCASSRARSTRCSATGSRS